ncbi:MAG: hypothetical protein VX642_03865 [Bdellovibrionota bacterium]|nr:hypothetical protein [Bdellovibrionota bacterium]
MRQKWHKRTGISKQAHWLVLFVVLVLFSDFAFSAEKSFGVACKYSVGEPAKSLDNFSFEFLAADYLVEKDTGKKYELLLPKSTLEKRMSTSQECGTCYIESTSNITEQLLQQFMGSQVSVDRVDFLIRNFRDKLNSFPTTKPTTPNARWLGDTQNYLEKWAKKKNMPSDIKYWREREKTYDFISSGTLGQIYKQRGQEVEGVIPTRAVVFRSLPRKTKEDIEFENSLISMMNLELVSSSRSIYEKNVSVFKAKVRVLNQQRKEKEQMYLEVSSVFRLLSKFGEKPRSSKIPKISNLNRKTREGLFRIFGYSNSTRKMQLPEGLLTYLNLKNELDKLKANSKEDIFSDPWVNDLYKDLIQLSKVLENLDQGIKAGITAQYETIFLRYQSQSNAYWAQRIKTYPELQDVLGLHELLVSHDNYVRAENIRKIHLRKKNYSSVENVVKALNQGKAISISYDYFFDHRYIPESAGAEFRVMDLVVNPNMNKGRDPETGRPYSNGGGHADTIINAIKDPDTGKVSHFILQGTHGTNENWNGKYLLSVDYFVRHVYRYRILESLELRDLE